MGIKPGDLVVNTKHINELTDQIRFNTDCNVIKLILDEHLDSVRDLFDDVIAEQKELLEKYLPLASPPSPTPIAIVKWIKKLTTATITPQLVAYVQYTVALIQLARSIAELKNAIQDAVTRLPECGLGLKDHVLDTLVREVDNVIKESLVEVETAQQKIVDLVVSEVDTQITSISTANAEDFEASYVIGLESIEQAVADLQQISVEE